MNNLFNMDNGFFTALGKICDMIFLSVVWVLLCIPIITIGPANTAMYYATVKVIRKERGYLFREFFKSFRLNFKRGAIVGVILTVIFIILAIDLIWAWGALNTDDKKAPILFGVFAALTLMAINFSIYVFPVLSRFDMTVKHLIKAAAFMSLKHLPYTLGMLVIVVISFIGVFYMPILVFILPAAAVFVNSFLMERVLKKYMPKSEEPEGEIKKDEWYMD